MQAYSKIEIGSQLLFKKEVGDSTMNEARRLLPSLASKSGESFWLQLEEQTSGRGQRGNSWSSPSEKGIYLTYAKNLGDGEASLPESFRTLSLVAGIVLADLVSEYGSDVRIKWPNDVYCRDQKASQFLKMAGILVETKARGNSISELYLGLGINYSSFGDFGSIETSCDSPPTRSKLVTDIIERFGDIEEQSLGPLIEVWEKRSFLLGREIEFFDNREKRQERGLVKGISERGELLVEVEGVLTSFASEFTSGVVISSCQ